MRHGPECADGTRMVRNGLLLLALMFAVSTVEGQPILSEPRLLTNGFRLRVTGETNDVYLIKRSRDLTNWTPVALSSARESTRTIIAPATNFIQMYRAKVIPAYGLYAASLLDLKGFGLTSDSFDSSDPRFSTAGRYDPTKSRDGGHVAAYSALTNAWGEMRIRGKLWMGSNGQIHGFSTRTSIGSADWVDGDSTGVQPGYLQTNLPATLLDAPAPPPGGYSAFSGGGTVDGEFYDYILPTAPYRIGGPFVMSNSQKILVTRRGAFLTLPNARVSRVLTPAEGHFGL